MEGRCDLRPPPLPGGCDGLVCRTVVGGLGPASAGGPLLTPPLPVACGAGQRVGSVDRRGKGPRPAQPCWGAACTRSLSHVRGVPARPLPAAYPGPSAVSPAQGDVRREGS